MKISEVRKEAREALKGKWGKGVSIVLAFLLVEFVFSIIGNLLGEVSLLKSIISLIQAIIAVPLSFGLILSFMKLKRDEEVSAFDFWGLGMENFSRAWKIELSALLKMIVPVIILIICMAVMGGVAGYYSIAKLSLTEESTEPVVFGVVLMIVAIVYIVDVIYLACKSLLYLLTTNAAYDNKNMTALEVVDESAKLMKGNRWNAFLLDLSFIGWMILAAFTLGIGFLWIIPYIQIARVCFYEKLAQVKTDVKDEENTENPIQEQ